MSVVILFCTNVGPDAVFVTGIKRIKVFRALSKHQNSYNVGVVIPVAFMTCSNRRSSLSFSERLWRLTLVSRP